MKNCPHCGYTNVSVATFCTECGQELPSIRPCPGCGFTGNPLQAAYCVQCGVSLRGRSLVLFIWLGGLVLVLAAAVVLWQIGLLQKWADDNSTPSAGHPQMPTATSLLREVVADMTITLTASLPTHTSASPIYNQSPTITSPPAATRLPTATPLSLTNALTPSEEISSRCPGASPQRVRVGYRARVCTAYENLVVRAQPGRGSPEITRLRPGTYVTVVDGPICADVWSWWKVQSDSGIVGWVAEGGDEIDPYFICPVR